jgi:hypothetical protein
MIKRVVARGLCLVIGSLVIAGCLGNAEDKAITTFENAISELDKNSASWQTTLSTLEQQLIAQGQSTLANEVQSLANRGISSGGVEIRCNIDFIGQRMEQGLRRIVARLKKQPPQPVMPAYCNVDPQDGIRIELVRQGRLVSLNYYGYDMFDHDASDSQMKAFLRDRNGQERDISFAIALPTHYLMTVRLLDNRIQFTDQSDKLVVRWGATTLSTINIIQPPPPPPPVIVNGLQVLFHTNDEDKDNDTGLSVTIANGSVAEWHQTQNEKYVDNSDHVKELTPSAVRLDALKSQLLEICISPNGNDTWRFNVTLTGTPSDGSRYVFSANSIELTQDNRCRKWALP